MYKRQDYDTVLYHDSTRNMTENVSELAESIKQGDTCLLYTSFEPANRKKFCSRIATGDYDAVIIGHSPNRLLSIAAAIISKVFPAPTQ